MERLNVTLAHLAEVMDTITLFLAPIAGALIGVGVVLSYYRRQAHHRARISQADRVRVRLAQLPSAANKLAYLRTINPYVFEELVLTAYRDRGFPIRRNQRYSRDGGFDGRVCIDGEWHLLQAKRYGGHIKMAHVRSFARLCERRGCRGLFVHTGRTGRGAAEAQANRVALVSGDRLVSLLVPSLFRP